MVLASSEHRLQLVFYHLLASLLMRRHFFLPPSSVLSSGSETAAEGVSHLLMRAAIDFSLTLRGVDGVEPVALKNHLPASSALPGLCYHATAKSTHRHNIYTVTLFSARASKRESQGVYTVRQREKKEGRRSSTYKYIYVL